MAVTNSDSVWLNISNTLLKQIINSKLYFCLFDALIHMYSLLTYFFWFVIAHGREETLRLLLAHGGRVRVRVPPNKGTPLSLASKKVRLKYYNNIHFYKF